MKGTCLHCDEPFDKPAEVVLPVNEGKAFMHQACLMRMVIGGVNHQAGHCFCCGGDLAPDPVGLTVRQAAKIAFLYYRAKKDGIRPELF